MAKKYESFELNIKKSWLRHPTYSDLKSIELSTVDESDLFNSQDWDYQYNISLDGVHLKLLWFLDTFGPMKREGYKILLFIDGRKVVNEWINFKDEKQYLARDLVNAFVFGK